MLLIGRGGVPFQRSIINRGTLRWSASRGTKEEFTAGAPFVGCPRSPALPLCQAARLSIALQATQGPGERCKSYYNYQMSSLFREDTRKGVCPPSLGLSPLSGVSWSSLLPATGTQLACVSSSDFHCPSCPLRSTPQTAECGVSPGVFHLCYLPP